MSVNHYDLLGVNPTSSQQEIKKAFKRAALKHHPDKGGDEKLFRQCCQAVDVLSDPGKKSKYDSSLPFAYVQKTVPQPERPFDSASVKNAPVVISSNPWNLSIKELKESLDDLRITYSNCLEKTELISLLASKADFPRRSSFSASDLENGTRVTIMSLGAERVGKTSFIRRFCEGRFAETTMSTVGVDFGVKPIQLKNGKVVKINFFDFSGSDHFRAVREDFYSFVHGVILMYDVTDRFGIDSITKCMIESQICGIELGGPSRKNVKKSILVASKCDLPHDATGGKTLADKVGMQFFESSAKNGDAVEKSIIALVEILTK